MNRNITLITASPRRGRQSAKKNRIVLADVTNIKVEAQPKAKVAPKAKAQRRTSRSKSRSASRSKSSSRSRSRSRSKSPKKKVKQVEQVSTPEKIVPRTKKQAVRARQRL